MRSKKKKRERERERKLPSLVGEGAGARVWAWTAAGNEIVKMRVAMIAITPNPNECLDEAISIMSDIFVFVFVSAASLSLSLSVWNEEKTRRDREKWFKRSDGEWWVGGLKGGYWRCVWEREKRREATGYTGNGGKCHIWKRWGSLSSLMFR